MADETIDSTMLVELEQEVFTDLSIELSASDENFNETLLLSKVKNAIREVKRARNYPKSYSDSQIDNDLYDYFSNIRNIALYDYNLIGAEGQSSSSENGTSRQYIDRDKLFCGICPFVRVL